MLLKELRHHWKTLREEVDTLPREEFISENPRPTGEWEGSPILQEIVNAYTSGRHGWLKGGQAHVQDDWISWPIIWAGKPVLGNCLKCIETYRLLSQIDGIRIAGFALMKGGVVLKKHVDHVDSAYKYTYHLGLKCPEGCVLHHEKIGDVTEEDGKHIVLDARYPHWAENTSDKERIILYVEYYS